MLEKFNLKELQKEILEDEDFENDRNKKLSQADIKRLIQQKRKARSEKSTCKSDGKP